MAAHILQTFLFTNQPDTRNSKSKIPNELTETFCVIPSTEGIKQIHKPRGTCDGWAWLHHTHTDTHSSPSSSVRGCVLCPGLHISVWISCVSNVSNMPECISQFTLYLHTWATKGWRTSLEGSVVPLLYYVMVEGSRENEQWLTVSAEFSMFSP